MRADLRIELAAEAVCLGTLAISVACSTTLKANDVGRDPTHAAAPPKTVIVFGGGLDEADRHALEDAFVTALTAHGVRATPSYRLFPGMLPSGKETHATLQQAAVEGALVSNLRVLTKNTTSVEADGAPVSWSVLQRPGWGAAYDPDRIATGSVFKFETSLWDLRAAKVVWSADTRTDSPSLAKDFASSLTKEVVPEMVKAGALPPPVSSTQVTHYTILLHSR
jgi:hypothetical protein